MIRQTFRGLNSWHYAGILSIIIAGFLTYSLVGKDKGIYLVGESTDGHHQIEMACEVCHTEPFSDINVLQKACVNCHGAELKAVDDSHPKSKFTDPRNAEMLSLLDARYCVTCHREHKSEITHSMGVTLVDDFCYPCHQDVADERPSHKDFAFSGCATSGCHNYHDNTALYEDFLLKHAKEPKTLRRARLPQRNFAKVLRLLESKPAKRLRKQQQDAPAEVDVKPEIVAQWSHTAHARGGVNCSDCHATKPDKAGPAPWQDHPDHEVCANCHEQEVEGFLGGKHGMRVSANLSPMQPSMARLPMKPDAADIQHSCVACHQGHEFDTRKAAVDACLTCHDDEHSLAYERGPHAKLWQAELKGRARPGTGVSCASCHLPREIVRQEGIDRVLVQHNQNKNLEPNEKMIRSVCLSCHGLRFSIDALADDSLIRNNFIGQPKAHIKSIDMARLRMQQEKKKKRDKRRR